MRPKTLPYILLLLVAPLWGTQSANPPDIIVIMADDMGWGDPSFNGGVIPTPNLDRLAHESLQLERFYTFPSCSPTRAAVLSGVFPHRLQVSAPVRMVDPGLSPDAPLLPQVLRDQGYRTAMIGKWHLGGEYVPAQRPHHRGFDTFYGSYQTGIDYFDHTDSSGNIDWWRNDQLVHESGYVTHLQAAAAEKLISDATTKKPLFLFFAPHAPHAPFQAPSVSITRFSGVSGRMGPTYAAMVSELDRAIGQILDAVDATGNSSNTIIIFFSDNGGTRLSSRGDFRGLKNTLYEGGIRSPFLIKWPDRIPHHQTPLKFVSTVMDLAPTLWTAAGVKLSDQPSVDGINLLDAFSSGQIPSREQVVIGHHEFTAISERWKLIQSDHGTELYDLQDDPSETNNLVETSPDQAHKLSRFLSNFTRDLPPTNPRRPLQRGR